MNDTQDKPQKINAKCEYCLNEYRKSSFLKGASPL